MIDALISQVAEHGPTWLIIICLLAIQTWREASWLREEFRRLHRRLDEQEGVLVDAGVAHIVERTDGERRLVVAPVPNGYGGTHR